MSLHNFNPACPSWEANSSSASQEMPRILLNPKVHHRVHNSPTSPPYPEPNEFNPHLPILFFCNILILSSHLRWGFPRDLFPSDCNTKIIYAFLFPLIRATCATHLILLRLISLIEYEKDQTVCKNFILSWNMCLERAIAHQRYLSLIVYIYILLLLLLLLLYLMQFLSLMFY